jgi:cell filamentation protein
MILAIKLNITDQVELARAEEKISKQKAKQLFDTGITRLTLFATFFPLWPPTF